MMVAQMGWWSLMIVGGLEVSGGEVEEVSGGEVERSCEWNVTQLLLYRYHVFNEHSHDLLKAPKIKENGGKVMEIEGNGGNWVVKGGLGRRGSVLTILTLR
ncbi:unnamed protein product [Prunus armeniaca]